FGGPVSDPGTPEDMTAAAKTSAKGAVPADHVVPVVPAPSPLGDCPSDPGTPDEPNSGGAVSDPGAPDEPTSGGSVSDPGTSDEPNSVRRPLDPATPEDMAAAADRYFRSCDDAGQSYSLTGLALSLGFSSLRALDDAARRPGFSDPLERAKLRVENRYEQALLEGKGSGTIFALKNFGWKDRTEHELNHHNDLDSLLAALEGEDDADA
ncbi:MAG: hypothetical protein LIQ30_06920, partial [Planctomycetes bacterium]|nr:hypothetical protein [Planctomycetota bacterium]